MPGHGRLPKCYTAVDDENEIIDGRIPIVFECGLVRRNNNKIRILDLGTTFRVKAIEFNDEYHHAWIVKLEVYDSGTIGKDFLDLERNIMPEKSNSIILANLLFIMGYRTKAENYLNQISDVEDAALVHFTLAEIHYNRGDYDLALEHFQI
ncbi:unnamed protein product [Didymodactylos carnosus]|uniref:Tetratricopeptide repeat protein n=1 Tax=Didymodactylos carnosus TaxID=1234261 RepID=A0A815PIC1_9BILA|nr:unnamed protein product [Didymodactylos carnosus]CAF4323064.1 unnamed protein product [Didymodactylos carnosus]